MRYVYCTIAASLLCGCQGNTTALRNPFATPNRVPPPATRVLQPGAAQPYYPGDPLPSNPAGTVFPPGVVSPPGAIGTPLPGSIPPGGWNRSPQSSITPTPHVFPASAQIALGPVPSANGPPIQINADQQNLRFASAEIQQAGQALWNQPPVTPALASPVAVQTAGFQAPVAPIAFAGQPQAVQSPREVRIRAVKSPSTDLGRGTSQDGFRPQGSRLINRNKPVQENAGRFGFDPQYQWLRGQIQVSQATGQWHLRYIPVEGIPAGVGTDPFGGQILIENPHVLGGLQPGDYVQVQGRLMAQPSGTSNYTVSIVQRQRVQ